MKRVVNQTPTVSTSPYTAGDAVGGLLTFDIQARGIRTILLNRVQILEDAVTPQSAAMGLALFTDPTLVKANADPFGLTNSAFNAGKIITVLEFSTWANKKIGNNFGTAVISTKEAINLPMQINDGKFYGQLYTTGTPTFAYSAVLSVMVNVAEYA